MIARTSVAAVVVLAALCPAVLSGCPSGARACATNADCDADEVCVFVDGAGSCGEPAEDNDDDAGSNAPDAGPRDAGPNDSGPDDDAGPGEPDAGPDPTDAGPHDYALTASPTVGASNATNGTQRLRARVRAAEVAEPMVGGTLRLAPPRR